MIGCLNKYEGYIKKKGVGSNDIVSDSIRSYTSYLNSVSKHLGISINPKALSTEHDVMIFAERLSKTGKVSEKTIKNYKSAMNRYVQMVNDLGLASS